jgi:hypothetical protein
MRQILLGVPVRVCGYIFETKRRARLILCGRLARARSLLSAKFNGERRSPNIIISAFAASAFSGAASHSHGEG